MAGSTQVMDFFCMDAPTFLELRTKELNNSSKNMNPQCFFLVMEPPPPPEREPESDWINSVKLFR